MENLGVKSRQQLYTEAECSRGTGETGQRAVVSVAQPDRPEGDKSDNKSYQVPADIADN